MKKFLSFVICILAIIIVYIYQDNIVSFLFDTNYKVSDKKIVIPENNEYKIFNGNYAYVSNTENFVPQSKQDILNIVYTTLNSGWEEFTFYCPEDYSSCVDDVVSITNDDGVLSNINGFVHPYNSFKSIETAYTTTGKITLNVHKIYTDQMINEINKEIDEIYSEKINDTMTIEEKIRALHDHIINISKYDNDRIKGITKYNSNTAYGNLIEGYGICSGYTDAMAIFLNKMEIENYKIASDKHIWNLVKLNGKWVHLDLTFDDPVVTAEDPSVDVEKDILQHDYFLIDTTKLLELDTVEHNFDKEVYKEAN